ncbi:toxin-antitoxin system, antitoxin component, Xre family protein [Steroidobacter cummioxidans]|uniref:toxin-antitoxin system, antitoxin component, Xre family protein n=1 Tax=Steroidobacter cummioxidans TaxID=1803913 RepID=UPI000E3174BC|nr:toxin-antitoxin system, antitoxin component, Xre family protein [Steroidobacter cummioxidans]
MSARDHDLIEKLKSLPPQRRAEVEDFVDFLKSREDELRLTHAAAQASEPAFKAVWDNPDDAEYDRL